jgi:hypothetical protein
MIRYVARQKYTDVSEEPIVSVFKVESEPVKKQKEQAVACSSILKMETVRSSETSLEFYQNSRRYIPEVITLQSSEHQNQRNKKFVRPPL